MAFNPALPYATVSGGDGPAVYLQDGIYYERDGAVVSAPNDNKPEPVMAVKTVTGRITKMTAVGRDIVSDLALDLSPIERPNAGIPLLRSPSVSDVSAVRASISSVSRTLQGRLLRGIKVVSDGTTPSAILDRAISANTLPSGNVGFLFYCAAPMPTSTVDLVLYLGDAGGYTNCMSYNFSLKSPGWHYISPSLPSDTLNEHWTASGSAAFGTTAFTRVRIQAAYASGSLPEYEIYAIHEGCTQKTSRVCITADDGYDSVYSIAAPTVEAYGGVMTLAIIASAVGSGGYLTLAQLKDLLVRGHEMCPHGPIGGTGTLSNYIGATDPYASILADVTYNRDYLVANDLARSGSEACYVYPGGNSQLSVGDTTIHDALVAAGMVGARTVVSKYDPIASPIGNEPFGIEISCAGHVWASSETEPTNINNIITRINAAAAGGRDIVLMFHKFSAAESTDSLTIKTSNLQLILAAIAANVRAGTQQWSTLSRVIYAHAGLPYAIRG